MSRTRRGWSVGAIALVLAALLLAGCGKSSASATSVAEACSTAAQRIATVRLKLHDALAAAGLTRGSEAIVIGGSPREEHAYHAAVGRAADEDAAIVRAAIYSLRGAASSPARHAALSGLEANLARLASVRKALAAGGEENGFDDFRLAEASGGCLKIRAAIGG